jgi:hypothetical protein
MFFYSSIQIVPLVACFDIKRELVTGSAQRCILLPATDASYAPSIDSIISPSEYASDKQYLSTVTIFMAARLLSLALYLLDRLFCGNLCERDNSVGR